jgi:hypothetical protein
MVAIERVVGERIGSVLRESVGKITRINQRYAKPTIRLSGWAKLALLFLEIYLFFLVGLLAYKFWTIVSGGA